MGGPDSLRCPDHPTIALEPRRKGWWCSSCADVVLTYEERPRASSHEELAWLDALPFPIAYPLWYTHSSRLDPYSRLWNAVFAAHQAMRVTGLLLLADYLDCSARSRAVNEAVATLRLPHWSHWTRVCTTLASFWRGALPKERSDREASFPWLVSAWRSVNEGAASQGLIDGLPGNEGPARSLNDAMARRRNTFAHGAGTRTPGGGPRIEEVMRYTEVASEMARTLFAGQPISIVRRVAHGRFVRLHGPHPDLRFSAEPSPPELEAALARTGVAIVRDGAAPLPLFPLFVPEGGDGYDESGGLTEPVTIIDEIRRQRVVLIGVAGSRVDTEHVRLLNEALARKEASLGLTAEDVTPWSIADWARALTRETLAELEATGASHRLHIARKGVDDLAEAYDAPGRALLLAGDSGSGRTSLLAKLGRRLVGDSEGEGAAPDDVVVVLDAKTLEPMGDIDRLLCDAVLERLGIRRGSFSSVTALLAALHRSVPEDTITKRRTWLLFDDVDAYPRLPELARALRTLLLEGRRYDWLRIVVTLRAGAQRVLFDRTSKTGEALLDLDGVWMESEGRPYVWLRELSTEETARAAELWSAQRGVAVPALEGVPAPLRKLIANPWYLRLFLESTTEGDAAPLSEDELLDRYLESIASRHPGGRATMTTIATSFLGSGRCTLSLEEAEAMTDRWREEESLAGRDPRLALDPIELLVTNGVLLKPTIYGAGNGTMTQGYVFAHPRVCRRVLVRALLAPLGHRKAPTPDEVEAILNLVAKDDVPLASEITEAVMDVGARLGPFAGQDVLEKLASLADRRLADVLLANALVARARREAPVFDGLVALVRKLTGIAAASPGSWRGCANALALAAEVAWTSDVAVTNLFARLLEETASPEDVGTTATTLRQSLDELAAVATNARAVAEKGVPLVDPRRLTRDETEAPPSRSVVKGQSDAHRLKNAKNLRNDADVAARRGDKAKARQLYETALAEIASMSRETSDSLDTWARVACLLANIEYEEGHRLAARDLHLASLAKLHRATTVSQSSLATPLIRCYAQLRQRTAHRGLRALYIGRMRSLLRVAPREGLEATFTNVIAALVAKEEHRDPPLLTSVRCPRCEWRPIDDSQWLCTCGHTWNTFHTDGVCPRCEITHAATTCLGCKEASTHSEWYVAP